VNYGATVVVLVAGVFGLQRFTDTSLKMQLLLGVATAILLPLAFFRHSRSLWMSLDYMFSPAEDAPPRGMGPGA
jgi:hypothetical protein